MIAGLISAVLAKVNAIYTIAAAQAAIWTSGAWSSISTGLSSITTIAANVVTLLSRVTATRAGYLDNLASIISGLTTEEKNGTLGAGSGTANVAVTETTVGKRFVIGTQDAQTPCVFYFSDTTHVTVARGVTDQICNYRFTVIRWS
jgi:hypothetical protein